MFHYFHDHEHAAGQGSLSADDLARLIGHIGAERIVGPRRWIELADTGKLKSNDVCLTFDDNLRCQYDVALPVLREYGLTAFWFTQTGIYHGQLSRQDVYRKFRTEHYEDVNAFYEAFFRMLATSRYAERAEQALRHFTPDAYLARHEFYTEADRRFRYVRDEVLTPAEYDGLMTALIASEGGRLENLTERLWMSPRCLRQLYSEGHLIGLHTHSHPTRLERLSPEEQRAEYTENHAALTALLGEPPAAMAHPCNSYTPGTLEILKSLSIKLGFRSNPAMERHSSLEYPRQDSADILPRSRQAAPASSKTEPAAMSA